MITLIVNVNIVLSRQWICVQLPIKTWWLHKFRRIVLFCKYYFAFVYIEAFNHVNKRA